MRSLFHLATAVTLLAPMLATAADGGMMADAPTSVRPTTSTALGGEMRYMADAARFTECLTGRSYPIVVKANTLEIFDAAGSPIALFEAVYF